MTPQEKALANLHAALGHKPLNRLWAKIEILLGLTVAGGGIFLGNSALTASAQEMSWFSLAAGLALFVLGGYLAMAGHRSHLYQSNNELVAYLAEMIHIDCQSSP